MQLYHVDSITGPEELYVWVDGFDSAYTFALLTDTFKHVNLGDIRVRRAVKNTEYSRFGACPYSHVPSIAQRKQ